MKAFIIPFWIFLYLNASSQNAFTLHGTTTKEFNNKKIYLVIEDGYSLNRFKKVDSFVIKDNSFSFSGTISKPCEWAYLYLKGGFF